MSHSTLCKWERGRNLICILEKSNPKTDFAIWSHAQERASRSGFEALSCACDFSLREFDFSFLTQKNVEFELPNSMTKVALDFFEMSNATQKTHLHKIEILAGSMWNPTLRVSENLYITWIIHTLIYFLWLVALTGYMISQMDITAQLLGFFLQFLSSEALLCKVEHVCHRLPSRG